MPNCWNTNETTNKKKIAGSNPVIGDSEKIIKNGGKISVTIGHAIIKLTGFSIRIIGVNIEETRMLIRA